MRLAALASLSLIASASDVNEKKVRHRTMLRKVIILTVFYIDICIQSGLVIGWRYINRIYLNYFLCFSSLRQILQDEGFFLKCPPTDKICEPSVEQTEQLTRIFYLGNWVVQCEYFRIQNVPCLSNDALLYDNNALESYPR